MKKEILFLLVVCLALGGCRYGDAPVMVAEAEGLDCIDCGGVNMVQYSMPNGNDLKLETAHHVIHIEAQPGKTYNYYVWTGDRSYSDEPDLMIENDTSSVLVSEE